MEYTWRNALEGIIGSAATRGVPLDEIREALRFLADNDLLWAVLEQGAPQVLAAAERAMQGVVLSPPAEPCDHIWLPSRGIIDGVPADQEFCTRCGARQ